MLFVSLGKARKHTLLGGVPGVLDALRDNGTLPEPSLISREDLGGDEWRSSFWICTGVTGSPASLFAAVVVGGVIVVVVGVVTGLGVVCSIFLFSSGITLASRSASRSKSKLRARL